MLRCPPKKHLFRWVFLALLALGLACGRSGSNATDALFQGLGDLPGGEFSSMARAVSADGLTVVGHGSTDPDPSGIPTPIGGGSRTEAFRWTADEGMVGLGHLAAEASWSSALGVSADGSTVVGESNAGGSFSGSFREAFHWNESEGMRRLSDLPGNQDFDCGDAECYARDVSADGTVLVGTRSAGWFPMREGFYWSHGSEAVSFGEDVPGDYVDATSVSADGATALIQGCGWNEPCAGFVWTLDDGFAAIDVLSGYEGAIFSAISADGSTVVGVIQGESSGLHFFRWTEEEGMEALGDAGGFNGIEPYEALPAVSADGSTIVGTRSVGRQSYSTPPKAIIWDAKNGMRSLASVLREHGADLEGWSLGEAHGVSDDGRVIVGMGTNPDGNYEAWIAHLP